MAVRLSSPTLVGRREELRRLEEALARALGGSPSVVLVGGEAGIGKSRLVETVADRARSSGARVLVGFCVDLGGGGLPYGPLAEMLGELADELDRSTLRKLLGPAAADLGSLLPGLDLAGRDQTDASAAPFSQARLFELLLGVLARLGERRPTLLMIEDLHWADAATRDLVAFWGRRLRLGRVLVVTTHRSDELSPSHPLRPVLAELARAPRVERIELAGLSREELGEQLAGILGRPAEERLLDEIHTRCEGNPFFAEELLAGVSAPGRLPDSLREILLARADRLGEPAQRTVRRAAVVGRRVPETILTAIGGDLTVPELEAAVEEAIAGGVLALDPGGAGFAFRHALMQEAVYEQLLPSTRRRLHRQAAEAVSAGALQGRPAERWSAEAHHWHEAGELDRALAASIEAAAVSERLHAHAAAYQHLERALRLWETVRAEQRPDVDRAGLRERAARAVFLGGLPIERAVELVDAALGEIEARRDPVRAGLLEERLGFYHSAANRPELGIGHYERAVELVPAQPPSQPRATVLNGYSRALYLSGRFTEAEQVAREAVEVARRSGARAVEGDATNTLGCVIFSLGHTEGLDLVEQARGIAAEVGDGDRLLRAYLNLCWALGETGDWERAAEVGIEGVELARRLGLTAPWAMLAANAAGALDRLGRHEDALALASDEGFLAGSPYQVVSLLLVPATIELRRGHLEQAERLVRNAELLTAATVDPQVRGEVRICQAELALARDDPGSALAAVESGLRITAGTGWVGYTAELCALGLRAIADQAERGHGGGGRALADSLLDHARNTISAVQAGGGTVADEQGAMVALAEAEHSRLTRSADPQRWDDAATRFQRASRPYLEAYAQLRRAETVLAGGGSRAEARDALRHAQHVANRLDAALLAARIDSLARLARLPLGSPGADGQQSKATPGGLTPREREVAELLIAGCSDKEIAKRLFISPKTASVHVSNIVHKLDAHNRIEAARIAERLGLG